MRTAANLKIKEIATISGFIDEKMAAMLLELGCMPGTSIELVRRASFGGPLYLKIDNRLLAFRTEEAAAIILSDQP